MENRSPQTVFILLGLHFIIISPFILCVNQLVSCFKKYTLVTELISIKTGPHAYLLSLGFAELFNIFSAHYIIMWFNGKQRGAAVVGTLKQS